MLYRILGFFMFWCYSLSQNYGIAIIYFTLLSKIILLPISIWVQKNSIKMVKMQPDIYKIKIDYFGDNDKIADETSNLYKKEKYNAFISLIPLFIQIILLLGVVEIINRPLTYILKVDSNEIISLKEDIVSKYDNLDLNSSSLELNIINEIKNHDINTFNNISVSTVKKVESFSFKFCGFDLSWIANLNGGISILIPIIAGLSAFIMCFAQNLMNVLQQEQSKINKYFMLSFSVALSFYLGYYVPAGVALYWTSSNLFAILLQWFLNIVINPKNYVNYDKLEKLQKEYNEISYLDKKKKRTKVQKCKENKDYKRFFKVTNKHLVFYSESNGFYKYYKGIIEYLLKYTNITIHYITSDYNDNIFNMEKSFSNLKAYYIEEKKLITLMMKMDADVVVMTMPDLDNYHIKKSYIRKDIVYVYIPHGIDSINLTQRYKSINAYDVFFAAGKYQREEAEATYKLFNLNNKVYNWGYTLLDDLAINYKEKKKNEKKSILIAPSWQKDNICDLCLDKLLDQLMCNNKYDIIVRPHPQEVRHKPEKFEALKEKYKNNSNIYIQTDFSNNSSILDADLLITDWSGICYEYSFTTKKPVLFIDTPIKVMNPNYHDIHIEPYTIWSRDIIGMRIDVNNLDKEINIKIDELFNNSDEYSKKIEELYYNSIYNIGNSGEIGARYLIDIIKEKINERRNNEK